MAFDIYMFFFEKWGCSITGIIFCKFIWFGYFVICGNEIAIHENYLE